MSDTNFKPGDTLWAISRKMLDRLNTGLTTNVDLGAVTLNTTFSDGSDVTQGTKADAAATDSTGSWSVVSILKGIWAKLNGGVTVSQATAASLKVSLADTGANATAIKVDGSAVTQPVSGSLTGVLTVNAVTGITNAVTVQQNTASNLKVDLSASGALPTVTAVSSITNPVTVAQATAANLKVSLADTGANATAIKVDGSAVTQPVSGNLGGKTTVIKDTTAVSTSPAYTAGDAVGAKRTLANALTAVGTGILESVVVLDRANQKAALEIFIFDADPSGATITDNAAFVFSTDDLKVIAHISVAASDYVTINSKAVAHLGSLGLALKAGGTSLYAVVVTTGTPTYVATSDVQVVFGILQD